MTQYTLINEAVPFGELELELATETPIQWEKRFIGKSHNEGNMLMIALSRHGNEREIQQILQSSKTELIQSRWMKGLGMIEPKLFTTYGSYEKTIHAGKNHWLIHYQHRKYRNRPNKEQRSTIIGFVGVAGYLMAPPACILAGLAETGQDLILVRRCYKDIHFLSNEFILKEIIDHLFVLLGESLFDATTVGSSAGGLAALCFGQMLQLPSSVAIGPSAKGMSLLQPIITNFRKNNNAYLTTPKESSELPNKTIKIYAGANNQKDVSNAQAIRHYLNKNLAVKMHVGTYFFKDCSSHNCFEELATKGIPLTKSLIPFIT